MAAGLAGRRVFVTGASGFLGPYVMRMLLARGADVHVLAHTRKASVNGAVAHAGDLLDVESLRAALTTAQPDVVFHLAAAGARPGEERRDEMLAVNVIGSVNLWQSLPNSVTRVVMTGTCREHAIASTPVDERYPCGPTRSYPATKHAAATLLKAMAHEDKREFVSLRLYGPYGPGDDSNRVIPFTIRKLLIGETVPLSDAQQGVDFAYVDDEVRAVVDTATARLPTPVATYNIGGGALLRLRDVLEAVADAVGPSARSKLQFGRIPRRPGDTEALCADITAARRDLGYEPAISLAEGLARTVQWHRKM